MGNSSFRNNLNVPAWGPPQAVVWISPLAWSSTGCSGISALGPGAPPPLLLLWHWCSYYWFTAPFFFFMLLFWELILPFLKYVTTEVYNILAARAGWNQLCLASPHRGHPAPALCHVHLFFPSFHFLSFPSPLFLLFHLLSSLTISSSLFLFSLSPSPHSLLPSPLSLHPIISNSNKRIILLLKQKYKTILNIFMKQEQLKSLSFLIFFFISIQNKESV